MCCPQYNPEHTRAYADGWSIFELVTTNVEVDEINHRYIKRFSSSNGMKIGRVAPWSGAELLFAQGARMCILKNIRKDYAITNDLFAICVGALFSDNETDQIAHGVNPACILILPDKIDGEVAVDTEWHVKVRGILEHGGKILDCDGSLHSLLEEEIAQIVESMKSIVPIGEVANFVERNGVNQRKWSSSIPLRLAKESPSTSFKEVVLKN